MERVEFNSVLALTYTGFLKVQGVTKASDTMKKQWIDQTVTKLKTNSSPEEIMKFFKIPQKYYGKIASHSYMMIEKQAKDNESEKILFIPLTLTISEDDNENVTESGIVLPS